MRRVAIARAVVLAAAIASPTLVLAQDWKQAVQQVEKDIGEAKDILWDSAKVCPRVAQRKRSVCNGNYRQWVLLRLDCAVYRLKSSQEPSGLPPEVAALIPDVCKKANEFGEFMKRTY